MRKMNTKERKNVISPKNEKKKKCECGCNVGSLTKNIDSKKKKSPFHQLFILSKYLFLTSPSLLPPYPAFSYNQQEGRGGEKARKEKKKGKKGRVNVGGRGERQQEKAFEGDENQNHGEKREGRDQF